MMEKQEVEEKKILVLSTSRVKTFLQCPRKYYYNYIERLPKKHWDHFDLGTLVHGALEFFHDEFRDDTFDYTKLNSLLSKSFKKQYDLMKEDGDLVKAEIVLEAKSLLKNYLKNIKFEGLKSKILSVEDEFELDLDEEFKIRGVVDRVDLDKDGSYHIKDYKTNKNKRYMDPFQLKTYGLYLQSKYPEVTNFKGSYIMMRFNGEHISYNFNINDVNKVKTELIDYARKISEEKRWISKPSKLCDWCDFKKPCLNTW